jgi:hypothetical protein
MSNLGCCIDKVGVSIEFDGKNEVDQHTIGRHFHLQLKAIDTTTNGLEGHATTIVVASYRGMEYGVDIGSISWESRRFAAGFGRTVVLFEGLLDQPTLVV